MMTRTLLILSCILTLHTAHAQRKTSNNTPTSGTEATPQTTASNKTGSTHLDVYRMAKAYADFPTATVALYYALAEQPGSLALKDSLAVMYFATGANLQCIALGKEILEKEPQNQRMLELVAISYQNIGALKESLDNYETLFKLSSSAFHLYQIAIIQFTLKRSYECTMSLNQLINHPEAAKEKINISIDQNHQQAVLLRAAAFNVLGVMQKENNAREDARKSFKAALETDKEFVLPQANLQQMDAEDAPKK